MKTDEKVTLRIRLEHWLVCCLESPRFPLIFLLSATALGVAISALLIAGLYA